MDAALEKHVSALQRCRACENMHAPPITGGAVVSPVMLVGQAPGVREPALRRPFAWTAGKTLFRWFEEAGGVSEEKIRARIYIASVCRCFPGKAARGSGDRVPCRAEIDRCATWLRREFEILQPRLVIPVGRLAIAQFFPEISRLVEIVGQRRPIKFAGVRCDAIALPHPSGASTWHRSAPGMGLTGESLRLITHHPAFVDCTS